MVVCNFNINWTRLCPFETDPILVIDANAMLTFSFSCERLQMISRRYEQLVKIDNRIKLIKFSRRNFPNIFRT